MKKIKLYGPEAIGDLGYALVDDDIYEDANQYKWGLSVTTHRRTDDGEYVELPSPKYCIYATVDGDQIELHRFVMGYSDLPMIDHINHNRFDNRRENLRFCTCSDNNKNRRAWANGKSKYLGVGWDEWNQGWRAAIQVAGKNRLIKCFKDEIQAAIAYDMHALKYHKEFANLNFPENREYYESQLDQVDIFREKVYTSKYLGVNYFKAGDNWAAKINIKRKGKHLGYYKTEIEAAEAHDIAIVKYEQPLDRLNFPEKLEEYKTRFDELDRFGIIGASGYYGVTYDKARDLWAVKIKANGKHIHVGRFKTKEEAAQAYDSAVIKYDLDRRRLNFKNSA